jgi:hypothetical protein
VPPSTPSKAPTDTATPPGSVFTAALVHGLRTGAADTDHDGLVSVDDAYAYVFDQVQAAGAAQTPQRWLYGAEGQILLARSPAGPAITPAPPRPPTRTGTLSTTSGEIRERRSPALSMIVAVVLLAIIGFGAYQLVAHHGAAGPTAAPTHRPTASAKPTAHSTPSSRSSEVVIHLAANEDCYVVLTDRKSGSQIYMGTIPAGSSMTWTEKQAVTVLLGNPGGIVLTVNGKRQNLNSTVPVTLSFSPQ